MKTVVAGGGGFIGSNLCRRLLHEGRQVVCIDNFVTGRHSNIDSLQDYPAFELIEADIIEGDLPDLGPLDEVYNLASPASPSILSRDGLDWALLSSSLYVGARQQDDTS